MKITYLGHAGFCVETKACIIIIDPWLSEHGAFDAAWFQYPKNHHMQSWVHELLLHSTKANYIYISHEHQDHFDIAFLQSLPTRQFTLLLAHFKTPVIQQQLHAIDYRPLNTVVLNHEETYALPDANVTLFIMDTEMNCDSAILVEHKAGRFLNLNDCKIHDKLADIRRRYGPIDVFSAQFSGASWYPTCYVMKKKHYHDLCAEKNKNKFKTTADAIQTIQPRLYWPAAGPPCFLDPLLMPIHRQKINTYPQGPALIDYLNQTLANMKPTTDWSDVSAGDTLDVLSCTWIKRQTPVNRDFMTVLKAYAQEKKPLFDARARDHAKINPHHVFMQLKPALNEKIQALTCMQNQLLPLLYWQINECPEHMYCLDLAHKKLSIVTKIHDLNNYYKISAPAWQINKVLTHALSWSDFALTLRVQLQRSPDRYHTLLHGFLILEPEKIGSFCETLAALLHQKERITIRANGKSYSILRYCPHQGADLSSAKVENHHVVCPRHHWRFDLEKNGQCSANASGIEATCLSHAPLTPTK